MKKLVVFDIDGTLLDSFGSYTKILEKYSKDAGLPIPCFDSIRHGYHDPLNHDFKWGVSPEVQQQHLYATFELADTLHISGDPEWTPGLFVGVKDMLTHFKDLNYTLAIVTSKPEEPLQHLLEHHRIDNLFCTQRNFDDVRRGLGREKPYPDLLLHVMEELNFAPIDTVMIGDTTMDIEMGKNAKTSAIGVAWGSHAKEHLIRAGACHILDNDVEEIVPAVQKVFSFNE